MNELFLPKYWLTWLGLGLVYPICLLPFSLARRFSRPLAFLIRIAPIKRKKVIKINLKLAFPDWTDEKIETVYKQNIHSTAMAIIESLYTWWAPGFYMNNLGTVEGLDHLKAALDRGKGVIILGAHFTTLEFSGRILSNEHPVITLYRKQNNAAVNHVMVKGRHRCLEKIIPRDDMRTLIKSIKNNKLIWYAPDQHFTGKFSVEITFFGQPVSANATTSRLAKMTGAQVLPFSSVRDEQGHYTIVIEPPLENFPTQDIVKDTQLIFDVFEKNIKRHPEQYFWLHRRFKAFKDDMPNVY